MHQNRLLPGVGLAALAVVVFAGSAVAQPGRVGGIVRDEKGEPIKGATITADNENIGSSFTATTDDKGRFTMIGLRSGSWRFIAQAPGFSVDGGTMPVRTGNPNPPMVFTLRRTGAAWLGAMAGITAKDLQEQLAAADALFNQQKWDEAIVAYRAVMSRTPALNVVSLQIAAAHRGKKDSEGAIAAYNTLLGIDPKNQRAIVGISETYLERGDVQAAEEALLKAAASEDAGREVLYRLAELKLSNRQADEAAKWYERASAADPSWGKPLYKLALMAVDRGDAEGAAKLFNRIIAVDPLSSEALLAKTALDQLKR